MTQEESEELKGKIFRDIETIKSNHRCQQLPRRSATITTESQRVGLLPTTTQQASSSTHAAAGSSFVYYTPSPIGFSNSTSVLTVQDEGSRHNLSGILSQLPDLTSTQIIEQPQPQQPVAAALYYHRFSTASTAAAASLVAIQSGRAFDLPGPFQGHQIFQKQLLSCKLFTFPF